MTINGFQRRTFLLEFEDPSFNGLEVRTRSADLDTLMRMQELMGMALGLRKHEAERKEFYKILAREDDSFGPLPIITSWNLLDDHNEPVPITPEQLSKEEWPMVRAIAIAWIGAVTSVPRPLSQPSSDGDTPEDLNLSMVPMETMPPRTAEASATTGHETAPATSSGSEHVEVQWWESPESSSGQSGS